MDHSTYTRRISQICSHLKTSNDVENILDTQPCSSSCPSNCGTCCAGMFQNQVAIVTGAGQGIGESAARMFAKEGAKVVVSDLDAAKAKKVSDEINKNGGKSIVVAGDITDPAFPERLIKDTISAFGKINVLVNNAGYTWDGMLHKMTDKQWDAMLSVHNTAPFRIIRAAAPYMRDAAKEEMDKGGKPENRCIINVSSTSGLHGNVGQANYSTAKLGIVGLTKTVAKEWGPFGVRCNAVAFGMIDTRLTRAKEQGAFIEVEGKKISLGIPQRSLEGGREKFIPLGRAGTADEAAGGILMLASPMSSYITGHCLEVTGGAGI